MSCDLRRVGSYPLLSLVNHPFLASTGANTLCPPELGKQALHLGHHLSPKGLRLHVVGHPVHDDAVDEDSVMG